jgi:prevent-host-death family protein
MVRTISATEAKNRLGEVMGWVRENQDEIIIESRGQPAAVIMSYEEYEKIRNLKEQQRREEIFNRLEQLREQVSARNTDIMTEDQALEAADQFTREAVDSLVEKRKVKLRR